MVRKEAQEAVKSLKFVMLSNDLVFYSARDASVTLNANGRYPIIYINTPAKPLNDAQIGGFFLPTPFVRRGLV